MAYRDDNDLEFLQHVQSSELDALVNVLTHDKKGNIRITGSLVAKKSFLQHSPDHHMYWQDIAEEIQHYGANSLATAFRKGKGVPYRVILLDVCKKLKVRVNKQDSVEAIENNLLATVLQDTLENMSPNEIQNLAREADITIKKSAIKPKSAFNLFRKVYSIGGQTSYRTSLVIINSVSKAIIGRGLTLAGNVTIVRSISLLAGPIGWIISTLWTIRDFAGVAFRVTVPAVIQIATLRQKYLDNQKMG